MKSNYWPLTVPPTLITLAGKAGTFNTARVTDMKYCYRLNFSNFTESDTYYIKVNNTIDEPVKKTTTLYRPERLS